MYDGIVIEESIDHKILSTITPYVISRYPHLLNHRWETTILKLLISECELEELMPLLEKSIISDKYYMHFTDHDKMWVIFRRNSFLLQKNDTTQIEHCKLIGGNYGIDRELMKFEMMFEKEHPNG